MSQLDRRGFLISVAAAGGGLALGFHIPFAGAFSPAAGDAPEVTAWIVIEPDDTIVIRVARSEMGQGALTALPMLVAEELECDWRKVRPEYASPAENLRRGRVWGDMSTGASRSVRASQEYLRRAGATAREMLLAAAARRWAAPVAECRAEDGIITHLPTGRRLRYGEVAQAAASVAPPAQVKLKDAKDWRLIGRAQARHGAEEKVTGKLVYAIDVRLPDMLNAAIVQCPVFGGRLRSVDETAARAMPGVHRVVRLPEAVAVVAETWWQAKHAADALAIDWEDGGNGALSSAAIASGLRAALEDPEADIGREDGDVEAAMAGAARRLTADYAAPFLAHATMEPQTCTAHVTAERAEIWAPTQDGEVSLATAAAAAGLPAERVIVHRTFLGGGFGRRGVSQDFVQQAVAIAREVGRPVKLIWSREEDIRHDFYRPAAAARLSAGLDENGMPVAWSIRIAAPSILASLVPELMLGGFDRQALQGLTDELGYAIPNYRADYVMHNTPVPIGMWRGVNHTQNAFFKECFVDEMAHAAGWDPYLFRRRLLAKHPKWPAVLDAVAQASGWRQPPAVGRARGLALHEACGSYCAQVVEISLDDAGALRVHRVVSAIDCGHVVNPRTVAQQTEGAVAFALTAALHGEIGIEHGRARQSNFDDYPMLRLADMPQVDTVIVPSGGFWGGVGEPPVAPLAPALCNAIVAAGGARIRTLPLKHHALRGAEASPL